MAEKNILPIDDDNFEREVLASGEPFVLDFTASWCGPCKALAPIVEKLAAETAGRLRIGTIDIDEAPRVAQRYGISRAADRRRVPRRKGDRPSRGRHDGESPPRARRDLRYAAEP